MNQDKQLSSQVDVSFTKSNMWSQLGLLFNKFQFKITQLLQSQSNAQMNVDLKISQIPKDSFLNQFKLHLNQFQTQIKNKLNLILYQSSKSNYQALKYKNLFESQTILNQKKTTQYQSDIKKLNQKIKSCQTLVKIYQKNLSQIKIANHLICQDKNADKGLTFLQQKSDNKHSKYQRLKIQRVATINIQNGEQMSRLSVSNLSCSRLTNSRMTRNGLDRSALKQLQQNWNKSINLSSKSLKSNNKEYQKSNKKEQKSFVKSHIKQKQLSRSIMKQNNSIKAIRQSSFNESTVSEFSILKN